VAQAEQASERIARLQRVTAALAGALTTSQVVGVVVEQGTAALGALAGLVRLLSDDGRRLALAGAFNMPPDFDSRWREVAIDAPIAIAECVRQGRPVMMESYAGIRDLHPPMAELADSIGSGAMVAAPLLVEGRAIGALALHFRETRGFDGQELAFIQALADQCALALERARLFEAERRARAEAEAARAREAFLAGVSSALAASLDEAATVAQVARLAVPTLADFCFVDLIDEREVIRRVATAHADPAKAALTAELRRFPPVAPPPGSVAERRLVTGEPTLVATIDEEARGRLARDPEHLRVIRALDPTSALIVPLLARGRPIGVITLALARADRRYDATDIALAEELARRCALAIDNAQLYAEARAALRQRDHFITTVTHDLKTPLTGIKGYAQALQRRLTHLDEATRARLNHGLAQIDATASKMTRQIDDLLDLARLGSGTPPPLEREPVELVALARERAAGHRRTTDRHRITVEAAVDALTGDWDRHRLERVVDNLLGNAIKYSPEGGEVAVRVAREIAADGEWAVLTVRDEGIGIPADDLPHIFERFQRAANVAGAAGGAGVGLASARQIVEQHGGTIAAESREGQGAAFTVRLPLTPPAPAAFDEG
jgi:signal transduction histidine kinase